MSQIPRLKVCKNEVKNVPIGLSPPDFKKVHKSWKDKFEEGVRSNKKPVTKVEEFAFTGLRHSKKLPFGKENNMSRFHNTKLTKSPGYKKAYDEDEIDFSHLIASGFKFHKNRDNNGLFPSGNMLGSQRNTTQFTDYAYSINKFQDTNKISENLMQNGQEEWNYASPKLPTRNVSDESLSQVNKSLNKSMDVRSKSKISIKSPYYHKSYEENPEKHNENITKTLEFAINDDSDLTVDSISSGNGSIDDKDREDLQKLKDLEDQLEVSKMRLHTKENQSVNTKELEKVISTLSSTKIASNAQLLFPIPIMSDLDEKNFIQKVKKDVYKSNVMLNRDREKLSKTKLFIGTERMEQRLKRNLDVLKSGMKPERVEETCPIKCKYLKFDDSSNDTGIKMPENKSTDFLLSEKLSEVMDSDLPALDESSANIESTSTCQNFPLDLKVTHRRGEPYTRYATINSENPIEASKHMNVEEGLHNIPSSTRDKPIKLGSIPRTPKIVAMYRNMVDTPSLVENIRRRLTTHAVKPHPD